jgi:hypothetical protein
MAEDTKSSTWRALLIADERAEIWEDESSYTQAGPLAGVPVMTGAGDLELVATGTQDVGSEIEWLALRGGHARSNPALAAGLAWRRAGDTEYLGWNPPNAVERQEAVRWVHGASAVTSARSPDALGLRDGTVLVAYEATDTTSGTLYQVRCASMAASTGAWTEVTVYSSSAATPTSQIAGPALCRLPSGRVLLFHWVFDLVLVQASVRVHYSDDDGATWAVGQQYALATPITYGSATGSGIATWRVGRLRAAYSLGQVVLFGSLQSNDTDHTARSVLLQCASDDLGMTFQQVEVWDAEGTWLGAGQSVIATPAGFLLLYVGGSGAAGLYRVRLGSAYEPSSGAASDLVSSLIDTETLYGTVGGSAISGVVTTAGTTLTQLGDVIYAHWVNPTATRTSQAEGHSAYTIDYGTTWAGLYASSSTSYAACWWAASVAGVYPDYLSGAPTNGRVVLATNLQQSSTSANEASLVAWHLGDWSTVTRPGYARWIAPGRRVGWAHTWVPLDLPDSAGWSTTGAGTAALSTSGELTITTTADTKFYVLSPSGTVAQGILARLSFTTSSGTVSTNVVSAQVVSADGTNSYAISIRAASTGYRVYDDVAGTQIGSTQTGVAPSSGIEFLVGIAGTSCQVWHRAKSGSPESKWIAGPSSTTLTDGAAAFATNRIQWGHRANGTATSTWRLMCVTYAEFAGTGLATAPTNPDDLHPFPIGTTPTPWADGVALAARSGPAVRGDQWTGATRYQWPASRLLPSSGQVSPQWAWRSSSTAEQVLAVQLSSVGDTSLGSDVIGFALHNTNVTQVEIDGWDDDTSAWVSLGTAKVYAGLEGLTYAREGNTVRPSSGTPTTEPLLHLEECAGWAFQFGMNGATRLVSHNAEGKWSGSAGRRPTMMLADVSGSEPSSGSDGVLLPTSCVILVDLAGAVYSAFRLTIPTPSGTVPAPAESYWRIGTLVVGPVVFHADTPDYGRKVTTQPGREITEARDRTRRAYKAAPSREIIEYGWTNGGVDQTDVSGDTASPDWIEASAESGALGVALRRGSLRQMEGLVRRLDDGGGVVVYLPRVARFAAAEGLRVLNRRGTHVLARAVGDVTYETYLGNELENEVARMQVRLEGEV